MAGEGGEGEGWKHTQIGAEKANKKQGEGQTREARERKKNKTHTHIQIPSKQWHLWQHIYPTHTTQTRPDG